MEIIASKVFALLVFVRSIFCGCLPDSHQSSFERNKGMYKVEKSGKLPSGLSESSGLAADNSGDYFWTHQDSGGSTFIFKIDFRGRILDSLKVNGVINVDWEDIATDNQGFIYIGDFGNNQNKRKNLRIYKINLQLNTVDTINFVYTDQAEFPPSKRNRNFDAEALVWHKDQLHIFSKNRGSKCVKHYILPDSVGHHEAKIFEETYIKGMITGADINPQSEKLALLSYGRIYIFSLSADEPMFSQPFKCIRFARGGQSEGIAYINAESFLISNEAGKLFIVKKKN